MAKRTPEWVEVESAGTLGIEGAPVPSDLLNAAKTRGLDLSSSLSRPIKGVGADKADLVIGMTLDHVAASVVEGGADAKKAFTFTEFIRLLESERIQPPRTEEEAIEIVAHVQQRRQNDKSFVPAEDVEDPMGGPKRAYEEMADKLDDLAARFARAWGWS